ncbi:MAG: MASE3 domain-containing protein [Tissierellia bacterium]|nr:MASE3 domain-containing protein [Tissierellia bacterium]
MEVKKKNKYIEIIFVVIFSLLFFIAAAFYNNVFTEIMSVATYLTWHNLFEFLSIIASFSIFIVTYYIYEESGNLRSMMLACAFFSMAFIDTFHTLSFKGMADFFVANLTANRATTFWILSRLIGSTGFLISALIPEYKTTNLNKWVFIIPISILVICLLIIVTYAAEFFPVMYIENYGLTNTKIVLEYIVVIIMIITFLIVEREYRRTNKRLNYLIMIALILSIFSEFAFISYGSVYDAYNYLGHLYKVIAYFFLFKAIYAESVSIPYRELKNARNELKDYADNLNLLVKERTKELEDINEILMNDIESARLMQQSILPEKLPESLLVTFYAAYIPAERLSGDFYNVIKLDEDNIALYMGDVAGHGVSAAMLTVFANQNIKLLKESEIFEMNSPGYVMKNLYRSFNETNFKIETYLVMLYGIYNTKNHRFTYSSAGINVPPMIIKSTGEILELKIEGFPICKLGNYYTPYFEDISIQLNSGDIILFYTDGLIEYKSEKGIMYSQNDLKDFLIKNHTMKAPELFSAIRENLFNKIGNEKIIDDVTFLIMEIN